MKKIIPYLVSGIVILALYFWFTQQPTEQTKQIKESEQIKESDTLIVGISPDYPPYEQIDLQTGQIIGLEVDIITEIAQRLHKTLIIKDMPFTSLIIELISGQIDAVAAGLSPTPEREKSVSFSRPYMQDDYNLVISKKGGPDFNSLQDLYGKQVAVNIGYTADSYLSEYPQINLVRLKSPVDGFMALQSGSVDAFVIAQSSFNAYQEQQPNHDFVAFTLPNSADACALAFAKNNSKLQEQVNSVLKVMREDGTVEQIQKKWGFA